MEDPILSEAREWLTANPSESIATASRIFKVPKSTLQMSITRLNRVRVGRGGRNKLLTAAQTKALKKWITTQYKQGLGATKQMTFAAICYIRRLKPPPSYSWLIKFIKNELHDFHTIKTKPIAQQHAQAQDESVIEQWFNNYSQFLLVNNIQPHSIWNMDETSF
jgi:transposase